MNKICLFLLFPVFVLNASLSEVFKLPKLVSHFIHHHELDNRIGFIDFMAMHYFGQDIDDDDQKEDMELPFKKIEGHAMIQFAIPVKFVVMLKLPVLLLSRQKTSLQSSSHADPAPGCLFRPPKA